MFLTLEEGQSPLYMRPAYSDSSASLDPLTCICTLRATYARAHTHQMSEQNKQEPSQISGQLKVCSVTESQLTPQNLQGMAEQAIGSVLPGATGDAWIESGQKLQQEGQVEVEEAKLEAKKDATVDSAKGKAKS